MRNFHSILFGVFFTFIWSEIHSQDVNPTKVDQSKYSFTCANMYFEIEASIGGRVTSLKQNGQEMLHFDDNVALSGSTLWLSPENAWNGGPDQMLDIKPYSVTVCENKVVLRSEISPDYKLRVIKIVSANTLDTAVTIKYIIKNEGAVTQNWAPWEVTRVPVNGLTFFAKGETDIWGNMAMCATNKYNHYWYNQNVTTASGSRFKFYCDGKGWVAHVNSDNNIFIKKFEDISAKNFANQESEVEVYTDPNHLYSEIENQGAFTSIPPGDSLSWQVKWYTRKVPSDVVIKLGGQDLLRYTYRILGLPDPFTSQSSQ